MNEERIQGVGIEQGRSTTYRLPATYSQQALWYVNAGSVDCRGYDLTFGYKLDGPLNLALLSAAIQASVDRHESLRTNFESDQSQIWQRIDNVRQAAVERQTVPSLAVALQLVEKNLQRRLDLEQDALFETHLFPIGESAVDVEISSSTLVFFRFHQIVVDQASIATIFSEVQATYSRLLDGLEPDHATLPLNFGAYANQQADKRNRDNTPERLQFWTSRIEQPLACIDLPLDYERPSAQSFKGAQHRVSIAPELAIRSAAFSKDHAANQIDTWLTCFAILIARYTRQPQQMIGIPLTTRPTDGTLDEVVGLMMNTLPLPISLEEELDFSAHLEQCQKSLQQMQGLCDVPLQQLAEALPIIRDPSFNPIYQVGFSMQSSSADFNLADCSSNNLHLHSGGAPYDMQFAIEAKADAGLELWINYDTALFTQATVDRMAVNYLALVDKVISHPLEPLKQLSSTGAMDTALLDQLHGPFNLDPRPGNLATLVLEGPREEDAIAVLCGDRQLTHAQLRQQSLQFAQFLNNLDLDPDRPVGVMLDRQLELCPTLLGLLASQVCYVPMDPDYPAELLQYVIADSGVSHILVSAGIAKSLVVPQQVTLLVIEEIWAGVLELTPIDQITKQNAENPAYVIYTSGSTGRPKGVSVPHRAVTNFITAMAKQPGLNAQDRLLAVTTLSFDISALELYGPIHVGGCVVLASKAQTRDVAALQHLLDSQGITIMQATPSTWRLLTDRNHQFSDNFRAWSGGEALPAETARDLLGQVDELWNLYGPTETTIWSTCCRIHQADNISIGGAIENTSLYILNEQLQPVPVGIPGELYIGGEGVASGYLGRDTLTKERFIDSPFEPNARLYRTGDLVRCTSNGELYHLGRLDDQVKIRGFRVELGQIEAVLEESPGVLEAVVIAKEVRAGDQRIIAYIAPKAGQTASVNEYRKMVRKAVPDYMVPQFFVILENLPRTPNGKLDRRGLPDLNLLNFENGSREPSTATQIKLAQLWAELIGVESISTADNFFAIGGHSMLAFQALLEINAEFGSNLKLPTLLLSTLAEIAQDIDQQDGQTARNSSTTKAPKPGVVSRLVNKIFNG